MTPVYGHQFEKVRANRMADLAYLLLVVGGFALLALLLRGVEQL